jgi:predicted DNA-binding protein
MVRTQISLTPEQAEGLNRLARERGVSMATVVREAVDAVLEREDREMRWQRALESLQKLPRGSGLGDLSVNHDKYLAEAYMHWHSSPTPRRSLRSSTATTRSTKKR